MCVYLLEHDSVAVVDSRAVIVQGSEADVPLAGPVTYTVVHVHITYPFGYESGYVTICVCVGPGFGCSGYYLRRRRRLCF